MIERAVFLTVAFATHAVVGIALVRGGTDLDARTGMWLGFVFGLAPDADFLFPAAMEWPFVHRGITHAPLFALALVAVVYAVRRSRSVAVGIALAVGSHLLLDSLSPKGIPWLFPLETTWSPGLDVHGVIATTLLWVGSLALLVRRTDDLQGLGRRWSRDVGAVRRRE